MKRIFIAVFLGATLLVASRLPAQCRGGGGGAMAGGTMASGGTGTAAMMTTPTVSTTGTGSLFTGNGSLAYNMMAAAAMQQQLTLLQMQRTQQLAAERETKLALRREHAEKTRADKLARRERSRQFLATQNAKAKAASERPLLASSQINRR